MQFEKELRVGIRRGEVVLQYQPIVELSSGEIVGAEALARWQHPERGMLSPCSFIPLAEQSELIVELGEHVLEMACRQLVAWRRGPLRHRESFTFAVNVSPRQLAEAGFVAFVANTLRAHGLPPSWLHLEITETALVTEVEKTSVRLDELKALGLALAIDDFGTGHASLSYLHQFPVDVVKIDRSFTASLGSGGRADSISRALIQLTHTLNMKAVAEGVEDADQIHQLRLLGCHLAQGYYFSPPRSATQLLPLLRAPRPYAHLIAGTTQPPLALVSETTEAAPLEASASRRVLLEEQGVKGKPCPPRQARPAHHLTRNTCLMWHSRTQAQATGLGSCTPIVRERDLAPETRQ